jgi:hypothetical protein
VKDQFDLVVDQISQTIQVPLEIKMAKLKLGMLDRQANRIPSHGNNTLIAI